MSVVGNYAPAPGTPAAIAARFQAVNPLQNATFAEAKKLARLLTEFGITVDDIGAIAQPAAGVPDAATYESWNLLKQYGIAENVPLYLHLKVGTELHAVGDAYRIMKSVGNNQFGQPNLVQGLANILLLVNSGLKDADAFKTIYGASGVTEKVNEFIQSYLG